MLLVVFAAFVAFVIAENRLSIYTALATTADATSVSGGADQPANL